MRTCRTIVVQMAIAIALCGFVLVGAASLAVAQQATVAAAELPDSPGATVVRLQPAPLQVAAAQSAGAPASTQSSGDQAQPAQSQAAQPQPPQTYHPPSAQQPQPSRQKPVGTAAAESPIVSGVAASQPAGVAIAPGKQRRVRTIVLRMGAIVGAGVALGSVAALTQATPSKPPGAH